MPIGNCKKCGFTLRNQYKSESYCDSCFDSLSGSGTRFCASCGVALPSDAHRNVEYCSSPYCGTKSKQTKEAVERREDKDPGYRARNQAEYRKRQKEQDEASYNAKRAQQQKDYASRNPDKIQEKYVRSKNDKDNQKTS